MPTFAGAQIFLYKRPGISLYLFRGIEGYKILPNSKSYESYKVISPDHVVRR